MTYDEFVKQVTNNFMHEAIYKDSEGRPILVIQLLDAYYMMGKLPREWVGLTEDEKQFFKAMGFSGIDVVEAKLKEKNSG